jgi:hypothetical protein
MRSIVRGIEAGSGMLLDYSENIIHIYGGSQG